MVILVAWLEPKKVAWSLRNGWHTPAEMTGIVRTVLTKH